MSIQRVQYKSAINTVDDTFSVTLDSAPSEGQFIVVTLTMRRNDTATPTVTGFTEVYHHSVQGDSTYRRGIACFYKVAGASESATITGTWTGAGQSGMMLAEVFSGGTAWGTDGFAVNDNGNAVFTGTSFASGNTASLGAAQRLLVGHVMFRVVDTNFANLSFDTLGSALEWTDISITCANAFAEDDTGGIKNFTASFDSITANGAMAGIAAFTFTPQTRKITITDLKAPNDANSTIANATGVQVKLWVSNDSNDPIDTGAPNVLFSGSDAADIVSGTMELLFDSGADIGASVLGVAKWSDSNETYFFPIDTTVEDESSGP